MLLESFSNQFSEFARIPLIKEMQRCSPLTPSIMLPTRPTSCKNMCRKMLVDTSIRMLFSSARAAPLGNDNDSSTDNAQSPDQAFGGNWSVLHMLR